MSVPDPSPDLPLDLPLGLPLGLESLLLESGWLQRLSRGLVRSDADADDVVQETWLAALREPGRSLESPRGWLATIARRAAGRQHRAKTRRADHESLVEAGATHAPDDPQAPDETVERLELARILALELSRLPDPYRGVMFLRYYEGATPAAIAKQKGVPPGTVRWQLSRGRELLRDALRARDGRTWDDWAVCLMPLAGAGGSLTPAGAGLSLGAVMSLKMTLVGALAGALTAGGAWLAEAPRHGETVAAGDLAAVTVERDRAAPLVDSVSIAQPTSPIAGRTTSAPAATDPLFGVVAFGTVVDEAGAPLDDVDVTLVDAELISLRASTGPNGGWSLVGLEAGEYEVSVLRVGFVTQRSVVALPAARSWRLDTVLEKALTLPVRFESPSGESLGGSRARGLTLGLGVAVTESNPGPRMRTGGDIFTTYSSNGSRFTVRDGVDSPGDLDERYHGLLQLTVAPPAWASLLCGDAVLESRLLNGGESELVFVIDDLRTTHGSVRVRVVDSATGAPLTDGITLRGSSIRAKPGPRIEGGFLIFDDLPPGTLDLTASIDSYERLRRQVMVDPGTVVDLGTIALAQAEVFEVRTVDSVGEPLQLRVQAGRTATVAGPHDPALGMGGRAPNVDGVSTITWLAPGTTLVRAGGSDGFARVAREIDTRSAGRLELVVQKGFEVMVTGLTLAHGQSYALEDERGTLLFSGNHSPRRLVLASGNYVLRTFDGSDVGPAHTFKVGTERLVLRLGGH